MSIPSYSDQKGLREIVSIDVPRLMDELIEALETAWGEQEDLEAEIEKLNDEILALEDS